MVSPTAWSSSAKRYGNPAGEARQGAIGEGRLDLQVGVDLAKAIGLDGVALHANGYKIFGDGLGRGNLFDLALPSGIEALPGTRLYELWLERTLLDGKVAVKLGLVGADTEFLVSQYAGLFVNATYGWSNITSYDLPSGGPAYPLAAPGARLKLAPDAHWTLLAAVFDGDPSGAARFGAAANPQKFDPYGTNFRLTDRPLTISEAAYTYGDKDGALLPGIAKLSLPIGRHVATQPRSGNLSTGHEVDRDRDGGRFRQPAAQRFVGVEGPGEG